MNFPEHFLPSPPASGGEGKGGEGGQLRLWITDFGLAQFQSGAELTMTGDLVGTLRYMSPEQALAKRVIVDHRTDIYSLGATLYELLTLRPPYEGNDRQELLRRIAFEEPRAPRRINPRIPAELETIVLKSLEKNPADRYATARELADDLRRYLQHEPIRARRAGLFQKARKWGRRHPSVIWSGVFLLLMGLVGSSVGLVIVDQKRRETANALAAETKALEGEQQARDLAIAALRDLTDDIVETQMARGTTLTEENKQFLRKIVKHYERFATMTADDATSRSIRAEGYHRVGLVRYRLGELKEAEAAYADALAIQKQLVDDFPARPEFRQDLAASYNNLESLLHYIGRLKEAEATCANALAIRKQLAADFPTRPEFRKDLAGSLNNLGHLLLDTGRLKEAEAALADALSIKKQLAADFPTRPEFRHDAANGHNNLGYLFMKTGRLKEAEIAFADALAIRKQLAADFPTRPEFRQNLARSHHNLATLLSDTSRLKEAEAAYADALAIKKQLAADFPTRPEFRHDLAISHNNLGLLFKDTGRPKEAEAAYADALPIMKQLAADFPTRPDFLSELARSHHNLGFLLMDTGRLKEAEAAYVEAIAIYRKLAADSPNQPDLQDQLARPLIDLGNLSNKRRDFQAAKAYLKEASTHHGAALKANPRNPEYRESFRSNLQTLIQANAGLHDQGAAIQAAQKLRDLGWDPPGNAYDAACALALCIPIVEKLQPESQARAGMQFYGDEAMKMLRDAVGKGFKDTAHMKKDTDLDSLRQREDFKKLLAELEAERKIASKEDKPPSANEKKE